MHFLHAFDVKIKRIGERVGDFSGPEGFREFANRIFDGETCSIADFAEDFIRGNMVGAIWTWLPSPKFKAGATKSCLRDTGE